MGWHHRVQSEIDADARAARELREAKKLKAAQEAREAQEALQTVKRMALADKIVMAVVDRVSADIIRPGPKPEERECYVMAQELREHSAHLKELVLAILAIEAEEQP